MLSTDRRAALKMAVRLITQAQDNHGDSSRPSHQLNVWCSIFAHQVARFTSSKMKITTTAAKNRCLPGKKSNFPQRCVRQQHNTGPHHDQDRVQPVKIGASLILWHARLETKPFANHDAQWKAQNRRREERSVNRPKANRMPAPRPARGINACAACGIGNITMAEAYRVAAVQTMKKNTITMQLTPRTAHPRVPADYWRGLTFFSTKPRLQIEKCHGRWWSQLAPSTIIR